MARISSHFVRAVIPLLLVFCSAQAQIPKYRIDPTWPKPLPNGWVLGEVEGIAEDSEGHIWITHERAKVEPRSAGDDSKPVAAPAVVEFDKAGNLLRAWGGEGYIADWPVKEHDIFVDKKGNVWITGIWIPEFKLPKWRDPGKLLYDRHVLKFSSSGKLLLEIGRPSKSPINNQATDLLGGPSATFVDEQRSEVYVSDGYMNKRILVFDSVTGAFKRGWGAYGAPLDKLSNSKLVSFDTASQPSSDVAVKEFLGPVNEVKLSADGLVYVADGGRHSIQVFTREGKFQREFVIAPTKVNRNNVSAIAFSRDTKQKYLLVSDGDSEIIWVMERTTGKIIGSVDRDAPKETSSIEIDSIFIDSAGNLYLGDGHRNNWIQRFKPVR
jgi:hypothetical protein